MSWNLDKKENKQSEKAVKKISMYFCPKCRSNKVYHPFEWRNIFGLIPKWRCKNCNFESGLFPVAVFNPENIKNIGKAEKKNNKKKKLNIKSKKK